MTLLPPFFLHPGHSYLIELDGRRYGPSCGVHTSTSLGMATRAPSERHTCIVSSIDVLPARPTLSIPVRFPDDGHDREISDLGYSKFFRTGLWSQVRCFFVSSLIDTFLIHSVPQHSCRISGRLSAFLAKTMETLRSLRARFARPLAQR